MKSVDKAINGIIAPRLKELGFARRHHTWNRREVWRVQVLNIQQSSTNSETEARFTVNLGHRIGVAFKDADWVRSTECRPEPRRLGFLIPAHLDKWYHCAPGDPFDVQRAARECLADIESYGLPWLESLARSEPPGSIAPPPRPADDRFGLSSIIGWIKRLFAPKDSR